MNYVCTKCLVEKPKDDFYPYKNNRLKGVMARCKECIKATVRAHRASCGPEQKKKSIEKLRAWGIANPERMRAANEAKRKRNIVSAREACKRWDQKYPHRRRMVQIRRQLRKRMALMPWRDETKMAVFYEEAQRLTRETGVLHTVDHIYPIAGKEVCGLHNEFNLQVLPMPENSHKGTRVPPELLGWTRQLPDATLQALTS